MKRNFCLKVFKNKKNEEKVSKFFQILELFVFHVDMDDIIEENCNRSPWRTICPLLFAITILVKYLPTTYALDVEWKSLFGGASRRYSQVRQTVIKSCRLEESVYVTYRDSSNIVLEILV